MFVEPLRRAPQGTGTQFVYGLHGKLGTGRNSALRQLEARLKQERDGGGARLGAMFGRVAATIGLVSSGIALRGASKNAAGKTVHLEDLREQLEAVRQHVDNLEGSLRGWADTVTRFSSELKALVGTHARELAQDDPRLMVEEMRFANLVDGLDRCAPETILATLDVVRHFLSARGAIFVLTFG